MDTESISGNDDSDVPVYVLQHGGLVLDLSQRVLRPVIHRSVNRVDRRFTLTPNERLAVETDIKRVRELVEQATAGILSLEDALEQENELRFNIMTTLTRPKPILAPRARRYEAEHPCETLDGAKTAFKFSFGFYFGSHWNDKNLATLAEVIAPGGSHVRRSGQLSSMEATLLLVARLSRAETTWDMLAPFFKRDPSDLSKHFNAIVQRFCDAYQDLIKLAHSVPFFADNCSDIYAQAVEDLLANRFPGAPRIPGYEGIKVVADGMRVPRARSGDSEQQAASYSGYTGDHNALYGIVVGFDGLVIGLTSEKPGSHSDASFQMELAGVLGESSLPALVDGIFSKIDGCLYPIPSEDDAETKGISRTTTAKYSALRVVVEWVIGRLKNWFPFAFCKHKMTIDMNRKGILGTSVILYNFITCLRGSEASLYAKIRPFQQAPLEALNTYLSMVRKD